MTNDSCGEVMARRSFLLHGPAERRAGSVNRKAVSLGLPAWSPPWSVFDVQTTGIDAGLRVIEVAMLDPEGRTLIGTMVNPGIHIPTVATVLSGIDDAAVKDAPPWRAIWSRVENLLLAQNHILAWSADFDIRAIRGECARQDDLTWTSAIDVRFVDLAQVASVVTGRERSFEDMCSFASVSSPPVGHQRAAECCRAALRMVQALGQCKRAYLKHEGS